MNDLCRGRSFVNVRHRNRHSLRGRSAVAIAALQLKLIIVIAILRSLGFEIRRVLKRHGTAGRIDGKRALISTARNCERQRVRVCVVCLSRVSNASPIFGKIHSSHRRKRWNTVFRDIRHGDRHSLRRRSAVAIADLQLKLIIVVAILRGLGFEIRRVLKRHSTAGRIDGKRTLISTARNCERQRVRVCVDCLSRVRNASPIFGKISCRA